MNLNSFQLSYVGLWGHAYADILESGNGGLDLAKSRSHFASWAVMKSPPLISTPLNQLAGKCAAIMLNKHLLELHQDTVQGVEAGRILDRAFARWELDFG